MYGNILFILNIDGVFIFKSLKFLIWFVYFMINEFLFKIRIQFENVLFQICGLWFGESKFLMSIFGRLFFFSLKNLEENGIMVIVNEKEVLCKVFLICSIVDFLVKCYLMNVNKLNSVFSCSMSFQNCIIYCFCKGGFVYIYF